MVTTAAELLSLLDAPGRYLHRPHDLWVVEAVKGSERFAVFDADDLDGDGRALFEAMDGFCCSSGDDELPPGFPLAYGPYCSSWSLASRLAANDELVEALHRPPPSSRPSPLPPEWIADLERHDRLLASSALASDELE